MSTHKEIVQETVIDSVRKLRKEMRSFYPTAEEVDLERKGKIEADAEYARWKAFVEKNGRDAYHALYLEPYSIGRGLNSVGMEEAQLRNVTTGLIMAAGGTEAVAVARFEKLAQKRRVGAPKKMEDGKRTNIYLSAESRAIAERIGGGNVSEGIRIALSKL